MALTEATATKWDWGIGDGSTSFWFDRFLYQFIPKTIVLDLGYTSKTPKMLLPKCVKKLLPLKFEVYFQCPTSHWLLNRGLCVSPLNNRSIIQPCARLRCAGAAAQHGPAAPVGRDCGAPWGIHGGHGSPLGWILSSLVPRAMGPPIGDITWLVGGLVAIFYFPRNNYWVANHPNWLSYFSEGFKTPTRWCWMIQNFLYLLDFFDFKHHHKKPFCVPHWLMVNCCWVMWTPWCFGTSILLFHSVGNFIISTNGYSYVSEGWRKHQPVMIISHWMTWLIFIYLLQW